MKKEKRRYLVFSDFCHFLRNCIFLYERYCTVAKHVLPGHNNPNYSVKDNDWHQKKYFITAAVEVQFKTEMLFQLWMYCSIEPLQSADLINNKLVCVQTFR